MTTEFTPDYAQNVQSNPQAWGFKQIAELDQGGSYEFDTYLVWVDREGQFFYAHDSGCSCPTPFEDFREPADLQRLTDYNMGIFRDEVRSWWDGSPVELADFFRKVFTAMSGGDKLAEEEVAAYLERKAEQEAAEQKRQERRKKINAVAACKRQMNEAGLVDSPSLRYASEAAIGDVLERLQGMDLVDVVVLAQYIGTLAMQQIKQVTCES